MTAREENQLIRRLQKEEKAERAARVDRLVRGLRNYGDEMLDGELRSIEEAVQPAVGRIGLSRLR